MDDEEKELSMTIPNTIFPPGKCEGMKPEFSADSVAEPPCEVAHTIAPNYFMVAPPFLTAAPSALAYDSVYSH